MSTERDEIEGSQPLGIPRVAVIGGGLAGLTTALRLGDLAHESNRRLDITIFEASDRLGGAIETIHESDYLIERGADSFLTKPPIVRLCERLGIAGSLIPTDVRYRGALVLRNGKPYPVPEGFSLMVPSKMLPILASPILSPRGKLRLLAESLIPAKRDLQDESLSSFVRRRLGDEAFERLVQPLISGIYTADPDKLSLAATLPRFLEMERRYGGLIRATLRRRGSSVESDGSASGARYGLFAGLKDGMEELFAALAKQVEANATVIRGANVDCVARDGDLWRVETRSAGLKAGGFEAVILAVPAFHAAKLLSQDDALCSELRKIPYASSAVVVTGHRLGDIAHPLDAFGLVVPTIEQRDVLAVSFSSRKFPNRAPEGHALLRTFIGGALRPEMIEKSDEELVAIVRRELASLLGVSGSPDIAVVSRYENAMPQYHLGHLDLVNRIEKAAAKHVGLELTGSAYRGVGIPDVVADAERAADAIFETMASNK